MKYFFTHTTISKQNKERGAVIVEAVLVIVLLALIFLGINDFLKSQSAKILLVHTESQMNSNQNYPAPHLLQTSISGNNTTIVLERKRGNLLQQQLQWFSDNFLEIANKLSAKIALGKTGLALYPIYITTDTSNGRILNIDEPDITRFPTTNLAPCAESEEFRERFTSYVNSLKSSLQNQSSAVAVPLTQGGNAWAETIAGVAALTCVEVEKKLSPLTGSRNIFHEFWFFYDKQV